MNDSTPFDTIGDEPVEARIVSWVLGEASAFEAAELERLCEERPELLVFRRRMRALNGLLTESEAVEPDRSWKLPEEKRKVLDEIFGEKNPARTESDNESRIARSARRALLAIAACVMLTLFLGAVFSTGSASIQKARKVKQAAQYSLPAGRPSTPVPGSPAQPASAEITNRNTAAGEEAYAGKVGDLRKSEIVSSSSTFADRKPAAESKNAAADDKSDLASTDGSRRVTRDDNVARPARPRVVPGAKEQLAESDAEAPRSRAIREAVSPASGTSVDGIPAEQGQIASGGVTNGLRMGDEAINRNNIDAILNNPNRTADEPISPPAEDRFAPAIQSAPAALAMELL